MLLPKNDRQIITDMDALQKFTEQAGKVSESAHTYETGPKRVEPSSSTSEPTPIFPSEVAQAAQMVDAVLEAMPPEKRPTGPPRWEAIATAAELLARDRLGKREGTARRFLLGLKLEWEAIQKSAAAAPVDPTPPASR